MENVPQIWPWIKAFVETNWPFIVGVYGVLRGLAAVSPWTWDEKLLDGIRAAFGMRFSKK